MITFQSSLAVDDVIIRLKEAIEAENMRLVTHINGQANAAKIGKTVPADQILEVFRPDFALRVWDACKAAGMDIPLRIHIYEDSDGHVMVSYREAREIFMPYQTEALQPIAEELDSIFGSILNAVKPQPGETTDG